MNKLYDFFFEEKNYINLALGRIVFFFLMLLNVPLFFIFKSYLRHSEANFHGAGLLQFSYFSNFLRGNIDVIGLVLITSYVFSMIGLFTKTSTWIAFLTTFVFFSIPKSYGSELLMYMPLLYIMFFLALGHSSDHFSIDALWRKPNKTKISKEYNWPVKVIQIIFVLYFFSSGFHKLLYSGLSWVTTDNLTNNFICSPFFRKQFVPEYIINLKFNYFAAKLGSFNHLIAFIIIIFELLSPLMLVEKFKKYFLLVFVFMHIISYFTLFVSFTLSLPLYAFWIDWEKCLSIYQKNGTSREIK